MRQKSAKMHTGGAFPLFYVYLFLEKIEKLLYNLNKNVDFYIIII